MKVIETTSNLSQSDLRQLIQNQAVAVRVKKFFHPDSCKTIASTLLDSPLYGKYTNAPQIGRVGQAFFETIESKSALLDYFSQSTDWLRMLRTACEPFQTPIDKLRLQLDECWNGGANLARLSGHPMYAGLVRVFETNAFAEPHQDHLDWDASHHEIYGDAMYKSQIAANVYLHMPAVGGELVIWPHSLSRIEYEARRIPGSYGVDISGFNAPLVISPEVGELILFNARHTHCVNAPISGNRVTASCFVGYRSEQQPLSLWS